MMLALVLAGAVAASCEFSGRWAVYKDHELVSLHNSEPTAINQVHQLAAGCSHCAIGYRNTTPEGAYRYLCITPEQGTVSKRLFWTTPSLRADQKTPLDPEEIEGYQFKHVHNGDLRVVNVEGNELTLELAPGLHLFTVQAMDMDGRLSDPSNEVRARVD